MANKWVLDVCTIYIDREKAAEVFQILGNGKQLTLLEKHLDYHRFVLSLLGDLGLVLQSSRQRRLI